ncbi:MAG: HEAT repeat domain-containing protein [Verrucomicrobiota bacterium]
MSNRFSYFAAIALAVLALSPVSQAQRSQLPRSFLSPDLLPQPKLSEEERATIDRALEDLQAENPELRAGAVMLLGKYHARDAKSAVLEALDDPSARVRRAALVSIAEWRHGLTANAVEPVLQRIADEDVEVRRAVTAMIPQMMNIWRTARMVRPDFANRQLDLVTQRALLAAYQDEDPVVRRNILINHHNLGIQIPPEAFVALMSDEDRGVRIEAIPLAILYAPYAQWKEAAMAIIEGDDNQARIKLTSSLGRRGQPDSFELLYDLTTDENPEIAAEARLALFKWTGELMQLNWLTDSILAGRLSQDQGLRFLQTLRGYRELAIPVAPQLTELSSSVLRQEAVRLYLNLNLSTQDKEILDRLLVDSNREIRFMVVDYLLDDPRAVSADLELDLLDNPYPDVRAALVQLAAQQGRDKGAGLLFDLMLDEAIEVRTSALQTMSAMRIDGWTKVVSASLDDPDFAMQRTALGIVLRDQSFPNRRQVLAKFLNDHPDSPLVPMIKVELGRGKVIEIDMNNL